METSPTRKALRRQPPAETPAEFDFGAEPSAGLGCQLGYVRHLLITRGVGPGELAERVRRIPGLEAFLVDGANRASQGRQTRLERFEEILARWGRKRTEHAVATFERKLFGLGLRKRAG